MGTFCSNKEFYPHVCNITKNLKGHILNRNMVPEAILTLSCKSQWNIPWTLRVMLFYFGAISCYTTGKNSQYSSYGFKSRQALSSQVTGDSRYSTPLHSPSCCCTFPAIISCVFSLRTVSVWLRMPSSRNATASRRPPQLFSFQLGVKKSLKSCTQSLLPKSFFFSFSLK